MRVISDLKVYAVAIYFALAISCIESKSAKPSPRSFARNRVRQRPDRKGGVELMNYPLEDSKKKFPVPDEQRLLRHLLSHYDTASRPVFNASHTVVVKFGLTLAQISDMDEVNQVLTTIVWFEQEWEDERLKWDPADYNGLVTVRMPCQRIWLPDVVLYNSADDFTEGLMQSRAMVSHTGSVFWPPPAKLRSSCKIDITYFPFDDQKCRMKFGSWTYDGFQVDVTNRTAEVDLANYVFSGEWELLSISIKRNEVYYACCREPFPDVTFTIVIRRRTLYYLFNIIFPCLWLTVLSLLGFWLPPDSGEKITLGITVLLAFSVFMLMIAENMPATSEFVPLMGIYLTFTMGMTSLSIVLTVFVLQLHHVAPHQAPVPVWIRTLVIRCIARALCMRSHLCNYYACATENENGELHPRGVHSSPSSRGLLPLRPLRDDLRPKYGRKSSSSNTNEVACLVQQGESPAENNQHNRGPAAKRTGYFAGNSVGIPRGVNTEKQAYGGVGHFRFIVSKHGSDVEHQNIVNEWKLVALIMDRFLFVLFLAVSTLSTLGILVLKPLMKPTISE